MESTCELGNGQEGGPEAMPLGVPHYGSLTQKEEESGRKEADDLGGKLVKIIG